MSDHHVRLAGPGIEPRTSHMKGQCYRCSVQHYGCSFWVPSLNTRKGVKFTLLRLSVAPLILSIFNFFCFFVFIFGGSIKCELYTYNFLHTHFLLPLEYCFTRHHIHRSSVAEMVCVFGCTKHVWGDMGSKLTMEFLFRNQWHRNNIYSIKQQLWVWVPVGQVGTAVGLWIRQHEFESFWISFFFSFFQELVSYCSTSHGSQNRKFCGANICTVIILQNTQ